MRGIDLDAPPAEVYAAVVELDEDDFDELMGEASSRERVIDALVTHLATRLDPSAAGDLDAVIHVKLWDRPGGGYDHRELRIHDGRCEASAEPTGEPDLTLKVRPLRCVNLCVQYRVVPVLNKLPDVGIIHVL